MTLNAYVAQSGLCSRRKAIELIKNGQITVNHFVIKDPAYNVQSKDTIRFGKKIIKPVKKIYLVFNKPQGCVTTLHDPAGRPTVMDFIALKEPVVPVGRLDYDTSGILLLTNDGQLGQRLSHPRYGVEKVYDVLLDKPLENKDLIALRKGIRLPDGLITFDAVEYIDREKKTIRLTIHSGKYRVLRRIFQRLGYYVDALDRVSYAGLTKRGIKQGSWRYLTVKEVDRLVASR